jgi:glycosidase
MDPLPWWNERVFYEIFVRSFKDSDGDGIGDLQGLIGQLDYLNDGDPSTTTDLGVTGIWLMPVAESPSYHGYDVTDYDTVERDYGTNDDFRQLMAAAHERGIAVIVDMVFNHTSVEHPWFKDAQTPGSKHESWYEWSATNPGATRSDGEPVWHQLGDRYYYGYFWEGMPDLNVRDPEVTAELDRISDLWLRDLGVDGFRMDAIPYFVEEGDQLEGLPETHAWLAAYQTRLKGAKPDVLTIGEVFSGTETAASYVPDDVALTFDFGFADATLSGAYTGDAERITTALETSLGAYPPGQRGVFLTNHDQTRSINKLDNDVAAAKNAAAVLLTSPGVPFIYYGEELGMQGDKPDERIRTPMPWTGDATNGGFTTGTPWETFSDGTDTANVATERQDPTSLWSVYRDLIGLRGAHPSLRGAETVIVPASSGEVYAVLRHAGSETTLVIVNFGAQASGVSFDLSTASCVTAGMPATGVFGQQGVAAVTDPAAYVPLATLGEREIDVIQLGGAGA